MKRELCMAILAAAFAASCSTNESKPSASGDYSANSSSRAPVAMNTGSCDPAPKTLVTKDLQEGNGRAVPSLGTALVFYTGWVYDPCKPDHKGAQFDSNVGKPVPFGFRVGAGRVIKGWDEGVLGMKEGGKRLLVIPANMAYGEREIAGKIPANSPLVFEVDLVQVQIIGQPPANPAPAK
jgi:FKBP-type peptidyl-prolyl cis-trans isomerase FkpA